MDISEEIRKIDIRTAYEKPIYGLGEIYEIMSIERLRGKLLKKHAAGYLYLCSNKQHSQRGLTIDDLKQAFPDEKILIWGYTDCPPWQSSPREEVNKKKYPALILYFAKFIFFILLRFEPFWTDASKAHMIYCLTEKNDRTFSVFRSKKIYSV